MNKKAMGAILKRLRLGAGFSQEELGVLLGNRSQSYVNKVETAVVGADIEKISEWVETCGHTLIIETRPSKDPVPQNRFEHLIAAASDLDEENLRRLVGTARLLSKVEGIARDMFISQLDSQLHLLLKSYPFAIEEKEAV